MKTLTILTTTYNREKLLKRLYQSLCVQTNKNFEWLIVDDGSVDNTKKEVSDFEKENKVNIKYMYQENKGKHKAVNLALKTISTPLVMIVDSDDFLTRNAVEKIIYYYNKYKDNKDLCGFSFLRKYTNGKINNKLFPQNEMIKTYIEARINGNIRGDKAEVFFTKCLKEFPFPEYQDEKFVSEAVVWIRMAKKYKMVHINEAIYVGDYLEQGMTKNIKKHKISSPLGYMDYAQELMSNECNLKNKVKGAILYVIYGKLAKKSYFIMYKNVRNRKLFFIFYPLALIIYNKWRREV